MGGVEVAAMAWKRGLVVVAAFVGGCATAGPRFEAGQPLVLGTREDPDLERQVAVLAAEHHGEIAACVDALGDRIESAEPQRVVLTFSVRDHDAMVTLVKAASP